MAKTALSAADAGVRSGWPSSATRLVIRGYRRRAVGGGSGPPGDAKVVRPLTALPNVEVLHLYESTHVMDGNLTPLLQLKQLSDFRMMNCRHYKPTVADIKTRLGIVD